MPGLESHGSPLERLARGSRRGFGIGIEQPPDVGQYGREHLAVLRVEAVGAPEFLVQALQRASQFAHVVHLAMSVRV